MGQTVPKNEDTEQDQNISSAFDTYYTNWVIQKTPINTEQSQELVDVVYPYLVSQDIIIYDTIRKPPLDLKSLKDYFFLSYTLGGFQLQVLKETGLLEPNVPGYKYNGQTGRYEDDDIKTLFSYEVAKRALDLWNNVFSTIFKQSFKEIQTNSSLTEGRYCLEGYFVKIWLQHVSTINHQLLALIEQENQKYLQYVKEKNDEKQLRALSWIAQNEHALYFDEYMIQPFERTITWAHLQETIVGLLEEYFDSKIQIPSSSSPSPSSSSSSSSLTNQPYLPMIFRNKNLAIRKFKEHTVTSEQIKGYDGRILGIQKNWIAEEIIEQVIGRMDGYKFITHYVAKLSDVTSPKDETNREKNINSMQSNIETIDNLILSEEIPEKSSSTETVVENWKLVVNPRMKSIGPDNMYFAWWSNIFCFDSKTMKEIVFYSTCLSIVKWYQHFYDIIFPEKGYKLDSIGIARLIKILQVNGNSITHEDYSKYIEFFKEAKNFQIPNWKGNLNVLKAELYTFIDSAIEKQWGVTWNEWPQINAPTSILKQFVKRIAENLPLQVVMPETHYSLRMSSSTSSSSSSSSSKTN
jgi:hypothetical protein